jgi:eukaryotic-like serine/threonine-protein kinase
VANDARQVRVFVSSPGDARFERSRLERVIERLNGEFQGVAGLSAIRWETEFYKAHETFQRQIPEAAQCDIVVAIFRGRLGTELPADFPHMEGGEPYPSGTAYEVLSAIKAAKDSGLPDVYVFRFAEPPSLRLDDPSRAEIEAQWERLKTFFETWFRTPEGQFRAAFQTFASTDEFEAQAEGLLRKWLNEKVLHGRAVVWPVDIKGSPFRGLAAFGAKHASVFFGRNRDIAKAVDRLKDSAEKGCAFLLVDGASGAGKSSLVRAGLVPRLTAAGVVSNVDLWRVAVMRPGELGGDPFAALARALFLHAEDVPDYERGRPGALPELSGSVFARPDDFAALAEHADETAPKPLVGTLDAIARAERQSSGYDRDVNAALLLVIDQLDELFGASIDDDARARFAKLLGLFARTGRTWIIATLRADLFDRFLAEPALKQLKDDGASYDLAPPDAAELAEIVRGPATAAGLAYEINGAGETLDERLLKDAERPDLLPLLQFTLNQLFEAARQTARPNILTFAAYSALGGLEGAVDKEAEAALSSLGEAERARLPRLLRELAAPAKEGAVGAARASLDVRSVPLAIAAYNDAAGRLVRALVDARILLSAGEGGAATVRLAHARVLDAWQRAKAIVADNADFYRIRADVEEQRRRWEAAKRSGDLLIGRGRPLAEAESIVRRFPDEIPAATRDFIRRSGRRARLAQTVTAAAAALLLIIAVLAGWQWRAAVTARAEVERQRDRAEHNLSLATEAANGLVRDLANKLRFATGVPTNLITEIIGKARELQDKLISAGESSPQLRWSSSAALIEYARARFLLGDMNAALEAAQKSNDIAKSLISTSLPDTDSARVLMGSYQTLGLIRDETGQTDEALADYNAELALAKTMTSKYSDEVWQDWRASADRGVGTMLKKLHRLDEALAAFREALEIRKAIAQNAPSDSESQRDVATATGDIGDVFRAQGHLTEAISQYRDEIGALQVLVDKNPSDTLLQDDLIIVNNNMGSVFKAQGRSDQALVAYEQARAIGKKLVLQNQGNARWQGDLAYSTEQVANLLLDSNRIDEAIAAYRDLVAVRESLASSNPDNSRLQVYLSDADEELGFALQKKGDLDGALQAYQASLAVEQKLAQSAPGNSDWQDSLAATYEKVGDVQRALDHSADALVSYKAGLDIRQRLTKSNPGRAEFNTSTGRLYAVIGEVQKALGKLPDALASYQGALTAMEALAKSNPANAASQKGLVALHEIIGNLQKTLNELPDALASYQSAFAIIERLAKSEPTNTDLQYRLSIAYDGVADVQRAQGDLAGALQSYQASLGIRDSLAKLNPDNNVWQQELVVAFEHVGDIEKSQGKLDDAFSAYHNSLGIQNALLVKDPGNGQWQRNLSIAYNNIGDILRDQNRLNDAFAAYRDAVTILQKLVAHDTSNKDWRAGLNYSINGIGGLAYTCLLQRDFAIALDAADQAISLAPDAIWLYTNRAHALMFLGRTGDARALYLKYRGRKDVQKGKSWEAVILEDFADLRKTGLINPLMDEIEATFTARG